MGDPDLRVRRREGSLTRWALLSALLALGAVVAGPGWILGSAAASDLSGLYPDTVLRHWQGRYEPGLRSNFERLVLGSMTPAERGKLGQVTLELPLRGAGKGAGDPLVFYAESSKIVLPVQSVKFFDDLSLAWGYAVANKLPLDKVTDYVAMLKYRAPPARGFPSPLAALGVPEDAWKKDKRVDDISQKILKSAMVWIMAHEVAHIVYRHPGYGGGVTAAEAQANEQQSDRFANEIMRRIGVAPGGMASFFMVLAHWSPTRGDFDSDAAWQRFLETEATHPFTASRMRAIASDLKRAPEDFSVESGDRAEGARNVRYIADQMEKIAGILEDLDIQRAIAARARATDPEDVAYRRGAAESPPGQPFAGRFRGNYIHRLRDGSSEELALVIELQRQGNRVSGRFDFGLGVGEIRGVVVREQLSFQWTWGTAFGQGVLAQRGQAITGTVGYANSLENAGTWRVERE